MVQVGDLNQEVAGRYEGVLTHRQVIGHAGEGRRDVQVTQEVGSCCEGRTGLGELSFRVTDFGFGIAIVEFLLQRVKVRFGHMELRLCRVDFGLRGRATLLQTLHGFQVLLRGIAVCLGLDERVAGGQHLFLAATA